MTPVAEWQTVRELVTGTKIEGPDSLNAVVKMARHFETSVANQNGIYFEIKLHAESLVRERLSLLFDIFGIYQFPPFTHHAYINLKTNFHIRLVIIFLCSEFIK